MFSAFMQYNEVLVTGGTGLPGPHVWRALIGRGFLPRLLVRPGSEGKIAPDVRARCRVTPGDLTVREYVEKGAQGTWAIVSLQNEADGKKSDVFGAKPRGSLIFTPNGRFVIVIMKESLPKFAVNSRVKGTAEENQAVVQGSVALFGGYAADPEKKDRVTLKIEGCTFPNWDGLDQKRIITVTGDELNMIVPGAAVGGTNYIVWKRIK